MGAGSERYSMIFKNEYLDDLNAIGDKYGVVFKEYGCWDEFFDKWFCKAYATSKLGNEFMFFMDGAGIDEIAGNFDGLAGQYGAFDFSDITREDHWVPLVKASERGEEFRMGEFVFKGVPEKCYYTLVKQGEACKELNLDLDNYLDWEDDEHFDEHWEAYEVLQRDIRELTKRLHACAEEIHAYCDKECKLIDSGEKNLFELYPCK